MALARFLQFSDLHLGRPFGRLPAEVREARWRDQQRVLEKAVEEAIHRRVHAILVPGDLFDAIGVEIGLLQFAIQTFAQDGCPPVYIAPGNHDPVTALSPAWNPRLLEARRLAWPAHVHVFDQPHWTSHEVPGLPGVRVWGRCFVANVESAERPLAAAMLTGVEAPAPDGLAIAVFHGSREGSCPPSQKVTAPFSDAEVEASPFTYHAVGHYHAGSRLTIASERGVRLAYAGSAAALDRDEVGVHGALEVRIPFGAGGSRAEVEQVVLDPRRVAEVTVDVTGAASADQIDRAIAQALRTAGVGAQDLATVHVTGRLATGVRWSGPGTELRATVLHLWADAKGLRASHDLDRYRTSTGMTTEERFARELIARLDATQDPRERERLEYALTLGLDAFHSGAIAPMWTGGES